MISDKEIETYIDEYIDMGHFARPNEARPYLLDGFRHGYLEALIRLNKQKDPTGNYKCAVCGGREFWPLT